MHIEKIRLDNPWMNLNCSGVKPQAKSKLRNICRGLWKKPFNSCHKFVDPHEYYILCLQHICIFSSQPRPYCDSLLAYSIECTKYGVDIDYLTAARSCRKHCPLGMVYKECGPECPATCVSRENENCIRTRCSHGCFCRPGSVLDEDGDCISEEECLTL